MIELKLGEAHLGLLPGLGGSLAFWRLRGRDLLVPTADPNLAAQKNTPVAGYPLVPFSNRIGDGKFSFEGVDYTLAKNFSAESNAIHGNGWEREWQVAQHDSERAILFLDHNPAKGDDPAQWPFAYRAVLSFVLHRDGLSVEMLIANRDTRAQPVGMGFHPFFARSDDMTMQFAASSVWENGPDMLPIGQIACEGTWNFATARTIGETRLDNCFAGWGGKTVLGYQSAGYEVTIEADPVFQHLVVFTAPEKPFVAVEAVSNMNNGLNHPDLLENGVHVLAPGANISGVIRYKLRELRG
ncbi:aldose 1-epimerase [Asaia siamensis]|uniref:Aldose 1-epimerase n=1 Tax=Asaia siamensis TaxID=110479 RepID=A0ABQ1LG41_9PROT|nr:aldose 1-epimerase [Asaia siamensis]GBR08461.1 aldose 1-epimerase [Asaia siamensis NRIC 0323]GGC22735.1 aldose 1-epimerase [Asaia siamensis]